MELKDSVTRLKGLGNKKAEALGKLKIFTIEDFLHYYPKRYEDRSKVTPISELCEGQKALIYGKVIKRNVIGFGKQKFLRIEVLDGETSLEILFFNVAYLIKLFHVGDEYGFFGTVTVKYSKKQMMHPDFFRRLEDEKGIVPIYGLTKGISQLDMRKWQKQLQTGEFLIEDFVPHSVMEECSLLRAEDALKNIHFPEDFELLAQAKKRLIFEEFFFLNLRMLKTLAYEAEHTEGISFNNPDVSTSEYIKSLKFELTGAQQRALQEIEADMDKPFPMVRLLQGDVGSGKTAVAEVCLYKAVKNGYQAVLMAPTQILAAQHFDGVSNRFEQFGINVALLSGNLAESAKRETLQRLKNGEIDVIVGTHALIQGNVEFKNLGLVIVDEQHRFGVEQRKNLLQKGKAVDVLLMTATPIPRSLAVAFYGSLKYSNLDELPPGRQKIETAAFTETQRKFAYAKLLEEIKRGRQAYIVTALIDDSDALEGVRSAEKVYEGFKKAFPNVGAALLHGEMKQQDKENIMDKFYNKEIDVLVSTVVIEVGINVPNATVMLIENAERFGLAQLHQLRGRVGRGSEKSYCLLINSKKNPIADERIEIMCETADGFIIAEKDLELRGPGEFFGERQHGLPELKVARIPENMDEFLQAKKICQRIMSENPELKGEEYSMTKRKLEEISKDDNVAII